jgi:hypothetical protein
LPYETNEVILFVPQGTLQIDGDAIQAGELFEAQGVTFETYRVTGLAAGDELTLRLAEPSSTRASGHVGPNLIAGLVVLAGAAALSYLYWQGYLDRTPALELTPRQSALLQAIADLDDAWALGNVPAATYHVRRARLKQALLAMMNRERPA